jgi:fibronectin type 3 domain-containing protein
MMQTKFYPISSDFLVRHNGTCYSHYWANWDQCSIAAIYAIGVLCDDTSKTQEALNYFYNGLGNGNINRTIYYIHPGYLGQWQESGRDQGHSTLGIALGGAMCEMAWHQGVDLYGFNNNRFLSGAEYVAKYNLFYDLPYVPYDNCENNWYQATISDNSRGNTRPEWELIYNHYVNRLGLAAPYAKQFAEQIRPEGYANGDQFGWGTLTFTLDPIASGTTPTALSAVMTGQQPVLSWWGSAYATSYNIKRATVSGGPYTTIATGTTNTYTDTTVTSGATYYYVVTASGTFGETAASNEASAYVGTTLNARLRFDEATGTSAADATGNGWTGSLVNSGTWAAGKMGNAVSLSGSAYVSLPAGAVSGLSDFTISTWVYLNSISNWVRIFDFGTGTDRYMYLSAKSASTGKVRFAITGCSGYGEQGIDGSAALPTGQWVHLAVVLSGSTGTLYVNGVPVGQNTSMSFSPFQLGTTTQNYIGHSQWSGDPYLNGLVDDFRIYRGVLSDADVCSLASTQQVRLKFDESSGTSAADASGNGWTGSLVNSPTWVAGQSGNAVNLNGSSQYVSTGAGVVSNLTTATFAAWVNATTVSNWMRIFDIGSGTTKYLFLTPKNGSTGKIRFAITTNSGTGEQKIDGTAALPTGGWHHVAVTLNGATGLLYVDGVLSGSNTAMTLNPSSLGSTTQNWIGRSQYSDPYLNGKVDDFRIFGSALSAAEVASLYSPLSAPATFTATAGDRQVALSWGAISNASSYVIRRSTTPGGPYTIIAGGITSTSYTDTGLTDGVTYYYVITAANVLGEGTASTETSAMPVPPPPGAPTGLSVLGWNGQVDLSWTASSAATSYNIKRSVTSGSGYSTIATGTTTSYSDTTAVNGTTYFYVVSASNLGGESANSNEVSVTFTQPRVYLKFDETSGSSAADSSGNGWNGTLVNGPLWSAGRSYNTVDLDGTNDYVSVASGVVSSLTDFTITAWVNADSVSNWSRIFDFGTGTTVYMFLSPKNGANGKMRYAITTAGPSGEQKIDAATVLPVTGWHHVAVTLSGTIGTLYLDGTQSGQNTAMTLKPSSLGTTTQNYIGHSQFSADPYLAGRVDEFRLYTRALTASEISSLMATSPAALILAPSSLTATSGTTQAALSWSASSGATSYDVYRSTTSGGPYAAVATGVTATSYTDTGLTTGTTYYYVIVARSSSSESPNSAEASATAQ